MKYSFVSRKNDKEYKFSFVKSPDGCDDIPKDTSFVVNIEETPKSGYYFPVMKSKKGFYVKWWHFWFVHLRLPSDLKKYINKYAKLIAFT